jgi:putative endonuclease
MTQWKWYVYIIECQDGTYYTGMTWNIDIRSQQHRAGLGSRYTQQHGFRSLVYVEEFDAIEEARYRERQIKDWSQDKQRKLISGQWGRW